MARILSVDYGAKRCGIAETDDLQLIASPLTTVSPGEILAFLSEYCLKNKVETLVVGLPLRENGELSEIEEKIRKFIEKFTKDHPDIRVVRIDEARSSKLAVQEMIRGGFGKKKRREKGIIDKISATLILQKYLEH